MRRYLAMVFFLFVFGCKSDDEAIAITDNPSEEVVPFYFPPIDTEVWESTSYNDLGWSADGFNELRTFLAESNTRAFLILKDGKIVVEEYFGNNILGTTPFNVSSQWYWASADKTLTAALVGIAQQDGLLDINDVSSDYLGEGWTSLPPEKEQLIKIQNQLTMSSGLEYDVDDLNCTLPSCLTYKADAGEQWYYHNAPHTLLKNVIENASGLEYNTFTEQKLIDLIGMDGQWIAQGFNNVFWSTARDMARFGILMLNKGKWADLEILSDMNYYDQMVNTSQNLNPSYGYLWWLNGKDSIIFPGFEATFPVPLAQNAPEDMIAAMGTNGQFLQLVPSQNLIVVRMGQTPDNSATGVSYNEDMWEKINGFVSTP